MILRSSRRTGGLGNNGRPVTPMRGSRVPGQKGPVTGHRSVWITHTAPTAAARPRTCHAAIRTATAHAPAIVIGASSIEPQRTLPRRSMSLPIICSVSNIVFRLPAMVISSTGCTGSPFSTQKPAAPRE